MFASRLIRATRKAFARKRPLIRVDLPGFDPHFYLSTYPDVAASGVDPLRHYLAHGWKEGRDPSAGFQTSRYLEVHPDVRNANVNPLIHYLNSGLAEGRTWPRNPIVSAAEETSVEAAPNPEPPQERRRTRLL